VYTRKPQLKIDSTFVGEMTSPLLFHIRRKRFDALDDLAAQNGLHLAQICLRALRCAAAQVTLATFGSHNFTGAGQAKPF